jgi:hypothetical protein
MAPMAPCPLARSTSSRIRFLSAALNLRRCAFDATSGSDELVTKGTANFDSFTMILPAALLCNYGLGFCLIIVGTKGNTIRGLIYYECPPNQHRPRVYLFGIGTLALLIVAFALHTKGDVKAGFKMLGIEFSIETKDRAPIR